MLGDYVECNKYLLEAQEAEHDLREMVREADHFINKRDGQWDPEIIQKFSGKPRFTFDECNPIIDSVMGELDTASFDIRVNPSGGESTEEVAKTYEGIIRNIENISNARFIYNSAARNTIGTGFSAWRIIHDFRDDDSFQQDLLIKSVPNAPDSVWFDPNATEQDMSDAQYCWVMTSMTRRAFEEKYPKGFGVSVGTEIRNQVYSYKKTDEIIVGEYLRRKRKGTKELLLLNNGMVVEKDNDFLEVQDELIKSGIKIVNSRKRDKYVVSQRMFDGHDWLTDEAETVFQYLPIVPVYGNYNISENKVIYHGIIEKLMDAQRVINYAASRSIEEGALSPKPKYWASKEQITSPEVRNSLRTMNTNNEPVQLYDFVEGQPPPFYQQTQSINPGLIETSNQMQTFIQRSSGAFDESRGTAPVSRSGVAIKMLQDKSDSPKRKWFNAMEIALTHTASILLKAIPKVYDTPQKVRLINQDGTIDSAIINYRVFDQDKQAWVTLNDLNQGSYDVSCNAGPAFHSRQQETVQAINEIAAIDPSIMQIGSDVLLNNIPSPGIDLIADRKRKQMLQQGLIPEDQLNDEEKQQMQAQAQQQPQPDPMLIAAQAEMAKAQVRGEEVKLKGQIEAQKVMLKELELKFKAEQENNKNVNGTIQALTQQIKTQAETLKIIKEAMGADTIVNPSAIKAYDTQARELSEALNQ